MDLSAYIEEVSAARAIFLNPISVDHYSAKYFEPRDEDPALLAKLRGFGGLDLEKDDLRRHSGLERRERFRSALGGDDPESLDSDRLEEAFGFALLRDSPFPAQR